jgi:hypothetical protein
VIPRLRTDIWVQALLRRNAAAGRFGAVIHKGAAEAGAVYVIINHLDGTLDLLGPPPGPAHDEAGDRRFRREIAPPATQAQIDAAMARKRHIDPDIWLVEIEDREGCGGLAPDHD